MEAWRAHGNLPQRVDGPEERLPGHHFALSGLRQEAVCAGQGTTSLSRLREQQQLVDALSLCPLSSSIINHNITSLIWYLGLVPVSSNDKAPVRCLWVPEMNHVLANQLNRRNGGQSFLRLVQRAHKFHARLQVFRWQLVPLPSIPKVSKCIEWLFKRHIYTRTFVRVDPQEAVGEPSILQSDEMPMFQRVCFGGVAWQNHARLQLLDRDLSVSLQLWVPNCNRRALADAPTSTLRRAFT